MVTHRDNNTFSVCQEARHSACKYQVRGLRDPCDMVTVKDGYNDHLVISDWYSKLHWVPMLVEGAELKLGAVRTIHLD